MRIHRVEIRNFRVFRGFSVDFDGRSIFVIGENAGGKTSLLTAIARALGADLSFRIEDFGDAQEPIELSVTIEDLSPGQAAVFGNYADFSTAPPSLQIATRAVWDAGAEEADVEHYYPRVVGSRSRRVEREALTWQWLPAGRDPARMLQFGVPRNLMGKVIEGLAIDQSLEQAIEAIRRASHELGQDAQLLGLLQDARNGFAGLLPDVRSDALRMGASAATRRDLLRNFDLLVQHLGEAVSVGTQSSGIAQLAIFVFAMKLASADPGTVLLIDEPEISLHPQAQRSLMRSLRQSTGQLFVATHSSTLLDRADPRRVMRLYQTPNGVALASPSALGDHDARKLARFTSPQTAEAFFARTVILVEGISDQVALEALAERMGRNLDAEGISIVPMGGVAAVRSFVGLYGPAGFKLKIAGMYDENEERLVIGALEHAGFGAGLTRQEAARLGFFVCVADLEEELIRAVGERQTEQLIDGNADLPAFRLFQQQPDNRTLILGDQLRKFIARHKVEYAALLVDALDLANAPAPMMSALAYV